MVAKVKKTNKISRKILITVGIILLSVLAVTYLSLAQHVSVFVWMASGLVAQSGNAHPVSIFLTYLIQFINVLVPGLIVGFILKLCKSEHAFTIGFIATLIAAFVNPILAIYTRDFGPGRFVVEAVVITVAAIISLRIAKYIIRPLFILILVAALAAVNIFALPYFNNLLGRPVAEASIADELSKKVADIEFTSYYPSYVPKNLELSPAKFEGYHNAKYQHQRVTYSVGKIEFMVSEKLKNQELVFNKSDNCDISTVWFEMRTEDTISQARIDRSRDNLAICSVLGKTDSGYDVYIEANKSQFEFYYMEIDSTIIVAQHDKLPRPRYDDDFKDEILKVFNSMAKQDVGELEAGY